MVEKIQKSRLAKEILNALKAVSDPTRIRILNILSFGAFSVNEIVHILEMGQSRISRHLKILTEAGLLQSQREGTWIYYSPVIREEANPFSHDLYKLIISYKEDLPEREIDQKKVAQLFQEREERNNNFFNKPENLQNIQTGALNIDTYKSYLLNMLPKKLNSIVDLGCGAGFLIQDLLNISTNVIGIDSSSGMLEKAREKFIYESSVKFYQANLESIPLESNSQETVIASMVLHHISNPILVLNEAFRILQIEGYFYIIDLLKHEEEYMRENFADLWLGFETSILTNWLKAAGFKIEEVHEVETKTVFKIIIIKSKKEDIHVHNS